MTVAFFVMVLSAGRSNRTRISDEGRNDRVQANLPWFVWQLLIGYRNMCTLLSQQLGHAAA